MSFMRGDLLTKTRKLVKGLAKAKPLWLKAMEEAPPVTFPRTDGKFEAITLPEDFYIKKFFKKYPDSKYQDAIRFSGFDPPPARVFGWRVLELKEQGASEEEAIAVADLCICFFFPLMIRYGISSRKEGKEERICPAEGNCKAPRDEATS
ncbi:hypothetical protein CKAN_02161800 [Cinnamomum micranthum f. kanehirae]|uniref:Small ribosomal subunit protein mS23 n=1 Tax=Cinnamomum micranthum f. kanehirae TaxID=337451 RepID=A0A443PNS1_9MAGN|nr:hypothetical protein CKAN_02161800 [Cinnamomum micranthum f. kanehirae]